MSEYVLVSAIGRTDPIRGEYDGPNLHIIRYYHPQKVYLVLSKEMEEKEMKYKQNQTAICLLDKTCEIELIRTKLEKASSYDELNPIFSKICDKIYAEFPDKKILLNISSGTPQMNSVFCMIALSDINRYVAVQVNNPEKKSTSTKAFQEGKDSIEEWFETDLDNEPDSQNRCEEPLLTNFRRPIVQFQIESLINNYDYMGAYLLYQQNQENFSDKVGALLNHATKRLNLEADEAKKIASENGWIKELYPVVRGDILRLVDFYNSMKVKQYRKELNDFSLKLEIMIEYLAIYILEKVMMIAIEDITMPYGKKSSQIVGLDKEKCVSKIPGIDTYLDKQFLAGYRWMSPINSLSIMYLIDYLSQQQKYQKYNQLIREMWKWIDVKDALRNPAAHTIVAITDDAFRECYDGKDSYKLCQAMQRGLKQVFGTEAKDEGYEIYDSINKKVKELLSQY